MICHFFSNDSTPKTLSTALSNRRITCHFNTKRSPHFGGLWEAAVKSAKFHLRRIIGLQFFTFEELSTILFQVDACLNCRPHLQVNAPSDDGIEILIPGHILIGHPLKSLPTHEYTYEKILVLKGWHLCQALTQHWWQRWSIEYLQQLQRLAKWRFPSQNLQIGDVVILNEDRITLSQWPLARIVKVPDECHDFMTCASLTLRRGDFYSETRRPLL